MYLAPGVYFEELASSARPSPEAYSPRVSLRIDEPTPRWIGEHSVAAFVGVARRGPAQQPTLIGSWQQFEGMYEPYGEPEDPGTDGWCLGDAVYGFFANGGRLCWVVNVHGEDGFRASRSHDVIDARR
jgi:uncharacterized protein